MSANGNLGGKECTGEEDHGVSMVDILEEEERLEADSHAVLGDSDDKHCTYPMGYVNRQALYSCQTCSTEETGPAGVCLACSYECHEGHDLIELYTKRLFRCDCGNSKFPGQKCKLYEFKDDTNSTNLYNQNFKGLYCTCHRPYPDPEDEIEDEMIQCIMCEDWFHGRHLSSNSVPDDYEEMVCPCCMKKFEFISAYMEADKVTVIQKEETDKSVDVEVAIATTEVTTPSTNEAGGSRQATSSHSSTACLLKEWQSGEITPSETSSYWPKGWRTKFCKCSDCMKMYESKGVSYLLDVDDTVHAYEERGRQKYAPVSQHDKELHALSQMDRIQQVEVLHEYNDLKTNLSDYLKKFAENGKMVKEEDIKEFFSALKAKKRQKVDTGVQYMCK